MIDRHHEFAARVEGQSSIGTVGPQHSPTGLAQCRAQRSRRVIQTGMDDPAVPPRLMLGDGGFLLDNDQVHAGIPGQELARHRETDDPTTDHADSLRHLRHYVSSPRPSAKRIDDGTPVAEMQPSRSDVG